MEPDYSRYFRVGEDGLERIGPKPSIGQMQGLERQILMATTSGDGAIREIFFDLIEYFYREAKFMDTEVGGSPFGLARCRAVMFCWTSLDWRQYNAANGPFAIKPLTTYQSLEIQRMRVELAIAEADDSDRDGEDMSDGEVVDRVMSLSNGERSVSDEMTGRIDALEWRLDDRERLDSIKKILETK